MTKEQFDQLVSLMEYIQVRGGNSTGNTTKEAIDKIKRGVMNFVGIPTSYSSITNIGYLSCKCFKLCADS